MALVEVARFFDMVEAQTAAAALRASGIFVQIQNEEFGQIHFTLQSSMGGSGLWTPEEDAVAARAFLSAHRVEDQRVLNWRTDGEVFNGLPWVILGLTLSFGLHPLFGWMAASARLRPSPMRMAVLVGAIVLFAGIWSLLLHRDPNPY
jgi:hypothetical protein